MKQRPKALPFYSVDTEEEAKYLQVLYCRSAYTARLGRSYRLNEFRGTTEDIDRVADLFDTEIKRRR